MKSASNQKTDIQILFFTAAVVLIFEKYRCKYPPNIAKIKGIEY